jgi:chorismate mutase
VTSNPEADRDPVVRQLREQISDNDLVIVNAINKRLRLVERLKDYKTARGFEFIDQAREDWMLAYLARANRGPLSSEGLREIYGALLDLTKREVGGDRREAEVS